MPPATSTRGLFGGLNSPCTHRAQLPVCCCSPSPVLELQCTQATTQPFVQATEDPRRLCQSEVRLPARQVTPRVVGHFRQTASTVPARDLPDSSLEGIDPLALSLPDHVALAVLHRAPSPTRLHLAVVRFAPVARASDALPFQATCLPALLLVRLFASRLLWPRLTSCSASSPSSFQT